jgi:hypothetical protein
VQTSSQARFLSEVGAGSGTLGTDLRIIFNGSEPSGGDATINVLELMLYDQNGNQVGNWLFNSGITYPSTETGVGNAGFGFALDATGAAQFNTAVQTLLNGGGTLSNISIGLGASLSDVQGGLETFSIARVNATSVVPEPSTYALMASGLLALVFVRKRRKV